MEVFSELSPGCWTSDFVNLKLSFDFRVSWTVDRGDFSCLSLCFCTARNMKDTCNALAFTIFPLPESAFWLDFYRQQWKVMFSEAFVCPRGGVCLPLKGGLHLKGDLTQKGESASEGGSASKGELGLHLKREGVCISKVGLPTPVITSSGYCSGRCASYWNAFFLEICHQCLDLGFQREILSESQYVHSAFPQVVLWPMLPKFTPFYHNKQRKSWEISTGEWRGEGSKESRSEHCDRIWRCYCGIVFIWKNLSPVFFMFLLYVPAILDKRLMTLSALTFDI